MNVCDPADHAMFIDEQVNFDLAAGALIEGHTWEALRDALKRVESWWPYRLLPVRYGGLSLGL